LLAIAAFSLTMPATRAAVPELGALFVGAARSVLGGALALGVLLIRGERFPRAHLGRLALAALGAVLGFPLASAIAVQTVPSTHATVVLGLVPIATASYSILTTGERACAEFWLAAASGVVAVALFGRSQTGLSLEAADGWLVLAAIAAAMGYAEGARVAREIGGLNVISWALVLAMPVGCVLTWCNWPSAGLSAASGSALAGLGYVCCVSMYLGMVAWYRGLSRGSVSKASQLQLLQPLLGLFWSWLLLHEAVGVSTLAAALLVVGCVVWSRRIRVGAQHTPATSALLPRVRPTK
jgi:drug/metabolite transporter (DMT)-like permease